MFPNIIVILLQLANRSEMADSDSDREELNYLLRQTNSQLRFIDSVFRQTLAKPDGETPTKYVRLNTKTHVVSSSFVAIESNFGL